MRRRAAAVVALAAAAWASSVAPPAAAQRGTSSPAPPLPSLPVIAAVRVDVARDHVVVTEDVLLARGEWRSGDLALYVAFGAPGAPRAFDAHLFPADVAALEVAPDASSEPIATERAARRPTSAQLLLGRPQMSGAVLHVREPAFRRATSGGGSALVRLRTLLDMPQEDAKTGREIVIRLGVDGAAPLTVGPLELRATDARLPVVRAEARLCGESADPYPLAIGLAPSTPRKRPLDARGGPAPTPPWLAVRHATDDLCVRFWSEPPAPPPAGGR